MVTKSLSQYAETNWQEFKDPTSTISLNYRTHSPLVKSDRKLYNYDRICESLFEPDKKPTSADGLEITESAISFVEFKTGFFRKVTKSNFPQEKCLCPDNREKVCKDYWNLFFKEQEKEVEILISAIRLKAIESYHTLEKKIIPNCIEPDDFLPIRFIVVIDEDEVDSMEDTLAELAGDEADNNCFASIRKALKRLLYQEDAAGKGYYYDKIEVLSAQDYSAKLQLDEF